MLLLNLLLLLALTPQGAHPDEFSTAEIFKYRIVNWCIVGQGEHHLYRWPLSQLKSYLLKADHKPRTFEDNNFEVVKKTGEKPENIRKSIPQPDLDKITLEFKKIYCKHTEDIIGDGKGNFLQRAHVQFTIDVPIQGLVIQAVHAPFGLGFPFGQFQNDEDFACNEEDKHMVSRIIGCVSRPDISLLHPTVGAFHFKLKTMQNGTMVEVGARQELHWNFKWADSVCSSANTVEFWVLIILDFDYSIWVVKKFGPYDFSTPEVQYNQINPGGFENRVYQPHLPSIILNDCNPQLPGLDAIIAADSTNVWPRSCFKEYGIDYNATACWHWKEHKRQHFINTVVKEENEANLADSKYISKINCHTGEDYFSTLFDQSSIWSQIRFVGDFDTKCVQFYNRQNNVFDGKKTFRQPHKICSDWQARFQCNGEPKEIALNIPWTKHKDKRNRYFPFSKCEPCTLPSTTPKINDDDDKPGFIKRGVHGGFMSFSFFFFLPVSITICRFYKETLHTSEVKGWRIWLLLHVGLAALTVVFSYIAYTFPAFFALDLHMYLGYAALFCCAGGLATGWFRHKSPGLLTCSFYFHGISGYAGWGLAIGSMVLAPGINNAARNLCYFASGFSLAAMAVLTFHVCTVDHNMQMTPRRSHIPILEIRFDDMFPPGHRFRMIFLYVYVSVQFLVCCGMWTL